MARVTKRPLALADMRSVPFARYVFFFRPEPEGIELVRVLHSGRDITIDEFESRREP